MATNGVGGTGSTGATNNQKPKSNDDALRGLDMSQFLNLMITELQNQDPLNPMENGEILQQISQIREIGVSAQLTDTLNAVLNGQNISSASALIGKDVKGLTDKGDKVSGKVDRVTISDGKPVLHVGQQSLKIGNVSEILPAKAA